jgi:hypothetical protein
MWELTRARDEQILGHAEECGPCGAWLQKQRTLAASMQTLQASTAGREAGPDVERALLQAFRQAAPTNAAVPTLSSTAGFAVAGTRAAKVEARERNQPLRPIVMPRSTPVALRLSRFFEIGAYAAVAAAILVGTFLGVRLLQDRPAARPMQSRSLPANPTPAVQKQDAATQNAVAQTPAPSVRQVRSHSRLRGVESPAAGAETVTQAETVAEESVPATNADYVALMFCDPLSCSSEAQVVRMELPGTGTQPQMADVVVGYDGVVRAVRIVN